VLIFNKKLFCIAGPIAVGRASSQPRQLVGALPGGVAKLRPIEHSFLLLSNSMHTLSETYGCSAQGVLTHPTSSCWATTAAHCYVKGTESTLADQWSVESYYYELGKDFAFMKLTPISIPIERRLSLTPGNTQRRC